ncbi:hypothetical protein DFQ27_009960 [Actinomortierella ambigua]|uniref:EF-hand domain-containing protein n=1 Tax=Actinomortierella ambigua TaxID=1343610 RepID=A0A9P6QFT5_9FUNG|nr:hypothetical protein DFQ26_003961 [Actinomortierella ambigua]KAG0266193.1 hypothetical protein DFQ27_009960 [Actinomortierella ambigua]
MSDIEIKEAFALFDPTNSGTIQPQAFQSFINASQLGDASLAAKIKVPSQPLDYKAFHALVAPAFGKADSADDAYGLLFEKMNTDGSGNLSAAEIKAGLQKFGNSSLSEHDIDELIHEADVSGDGRVTLEEFLKIMQRSEKKLRGEFVV